LNICGSRCPSCGALVTRLTPRPWWYGGTRQALIGGVAAAVTYAFGALVGAVS